MSEDPKLSALPSSMLSLEKLRTKSASNTEQPKTVVVHVPSFEGSVELRELFYGDYLAANKAATKLVKGKKVIDDMESMKHMLLRSFVQPKLDVTDVFLIDKWSMNVVTKLFQAALKISGFEIDEKKDEDEEAPDTQDFPDSPSAA
jgi:hypothetical protein